VTFEQILAQGVLGTRVFKLNPARYREIHQDWLYRTGREPRPASFYDGGTNAD
jgi:hypothetical protein